MTTTSHARLTPSFNSARRVSNARSAEPALRLHRKHKNINALDVANEAEWPRFVTLARRSLSEKVIAREIGATRAVLDMWSVGREVPGARTRVLMKEALARALHEQLIDHNRLANPVYPARRRHL
jgi:hypothetical protein